MTTRLATQRNFILSTANANVAPTPPTDAGGQSVATITTIDDDHVAIVNVLPANDIKNELVSIETTNACSSSSHGDHFEYIESAVDVVEEVMTQVRESFILLLKHIYRWYCMYIYIFLTTFY